jgi:hypothetical protein
MKIFWTDFAIQNLKDIFDYYSENANKKVAHKIRKQILASSKQLIQNPKSGQIEINLEKMNHKYRYLVVGNYKVIYKLFENEIRIADVFDTRQNPIKIEREK